jgi:hypothetical protein
MANMPIIVAASSSIFFQRGMTITPSASSPEKARCIRIMRDRDPLFAAHRARIVRQRAAFACYGSSGQTFMLAEKVAPVIDCVHLHFFGIADLFHDFALRF